MVNDMIVTGFVFKDSEDDVYLGLFQNGHVASFDIISDWDDIYADLPETKIMVVDVIINNDSLSIRDIMSLEIGTKTDEGIFEEVSVKTMLYDMDFPSEDADMLFASYTNAAKRTN